jgi:hypothetical protein
MRSYMLKGSMKFMFAITTALTAAMAPVAGHAQIQPVFFGTAEADTEDMRLFLIGASFQRAALGLQPFAGVTAYQLKYPALTGTGQQAATVNTSAVNPSVGLRYSTPTTSVQGAIGYLFLVSDEAPATGVFGAPGGTRDGITASGMGEVSGNRGVNLQAIVNYNVGDEYVWARGRGAVGVMPMGAGWLRVGAEVVGQGGGVDAGERYSAWQVGPFVDAQVARPLRVLLGAGIKGDNANRADASSTFPYFKMEFVLVP